LIDPPEKPLIRRIRGENRAEYPEKIITLAMAIAASTSVYNL
jgi:hypothetical protein